MKPLIKTLLILIVAVAASFTTHSCSMGSLKKSCKKTKPVANVQLAEEDLGTWQMSAKFNY